jgi:GTP-binding protein
LNKAFETIKSEKTGVKRGRAARPKIYYATQISANPITILMFVNNPELFDENYKRFIVNKLQTLLSVSEVPIRLLARPHRK